MNTTFVNNIGKNYGGAIATTDVREIKIKDSLFYHNQATKYGGALIIFGTDANLRFIIEFENLVMYNNSAG